ncbi:MAG: hypothetical protein HY664_01965 [Chloroflexi bacterium]|nr:hypothetical protein [Chloroflexota bacterium]
MASMSISRLAFGVLVVLILLPFLIPVIVVLGMFGGFIVVPVIAIGLIGLIIAGPVFVVAAVVQRVRMPLQRRLVHTKVAEEAIIARIVQMNGLCARKISYKPGDEFVFQTEKKVFPSLCGPAYHGVLPFVSKFRTSQSDSTCKIQCPLSGSVITFQLQKKVT